MARRILQLALVLLFIAPLALALEQGDIVEEGAFANGTLDAGFSLNSSSRFTDSPTPVRMTFTIRNSYATDLHVFLAVRSDGGWEVVDEVGVAPAGRTAVLEYNASFQYGGSTTEDTEFALVAENGGGMVGRQFSVPEQWEAYESYLKGSLFGLGIFIVPVLGAVLLVLVTTALFAALGRKHHPKEGDEYTVRTLFLPHVRGRPIGEIVADLIINPAFWLFELACGLLLVLLILLLSVVSISLEIALIVFVIGGVVCWLMPFVYLLLAWLLDIWDREPLRFPASLFLWGIMAAFIAFWINTILGVFLDALLGVGLGRIGTGIASIIGAIMIAPVVEELAKGFGVLVVSGHHEMHDTYDGLLYGFAAGVGFAAIENWFYFAAQNNPAAAGGIGGWLFLVAYRSLFNSLGHGWFTASTGALIGFMKNRPSLRRYAFLGFIPGVLIAMALHAIFNFFAVVDGVIEFVTQMPIFIFNPTLVVLLTLAYLVLMALALLETRGRVAQAAKDGI